MSISDADMAHLLELARLAVSDAEAAALKEDLNDILGYFEQLRDLDTEGVEELARPIVTENVFRDDHVTSSLPEAAVTALAVEEQDGYFRVPRTVDEG